MKLVDEPLSEPQRDDLAKLYAAPGWGLLRHILQGELEKRLQATAELTARYVETDMSETQHRALVLVARQARRLNDTINVLLEVQSGAIPNVLVRALSPS